MATPFESNHKAFSDRAHEAAKKLVYPRIFNVPADALSFESHDVADGGINQILDGSLGIDKTVGIQCNHLHQSLEFTIQERFRLPKYAGYDDLTITEWNGATDLPSELYKLKAQLFVYGYYDESTNTFSDAIAVNVLRMLQGIATKELKYSQEQNNKAQDFIAVKFNDLKEYGAVVYWQKIAPPVARKGRKISSYMEFAELWPAVLVRMKKKIGLTGAAYLFAAYPAKLTEDEVIVRFTKEFHYEKACEAAKRLPFEQVMNECLNHPRRLTFEWRKPDAPEAVQL